MSLLFDRETVSAEQMMESIRLFKHLGIVPISDGLRKGVGFVLNVDEFNRTVAMGRSVKKKCKATQTEDDIGVAHRCPSPSVFSKEFREL